MSVDIRNYSNSTPVHRDYGAVILEVAGIDTGLENVGLCKVEMKAGSKSPLHFHKVMSEIYLITEGSGLMTLGETARKVAAGDCVSIPPGIVHAIENVGSGTLSFFAVTSPSFIEADSFDI
jgi:mannose-6-phosphate isomerase-like protein (cupin superfamily)